MNNKYFLFSAFSDGYGATNPDAGLSPIAKMEKYAASENIFNRLVENRKQQQYFLDNNIMHCYSQIVLGKTHKIINKVFFYLSNH